MILDSPFRQWGRASTIVSDSDVCNRCVHVWPGPGTGADRGRASHGILIFASETHHRISACTGDHGGLRRRMQGCRPEILPGRIALPGTFESKLCSVSFETPFGFLFFFTHDMPSGVYWLKLIEANQSRFGGPARKHTTEFQGNQSLNPGCNFIRAIICAS